MSKTLTKGRPKRVKPPNNKGKYTFRRTARVTTKPVKRVLTPKQLTAIVALVKGGTDDEAGAVAGVGRQSISRWRHDPMFVARLNAEQNRIARAAMNTYQKWMTKATASAVNEVGKAIMRGDVSTAKWLLEKVGIENFAKLIFEQTVSPVLAPEDTGAVVDVMAGENVDAFLAAKGVSPLERLRLREGLTAKEAEALREGIGKDSDEKGG